MVGITAFGGYVPRLRLARKTIVAAHLWSDPGLKGKARGERSMCNWDEDAVTMAVEAARNCLASAAAPQAILFASTSAPFADRQNAGVHQSAPSRLPDANQGPNELRDCRCASSARRCDVETGGQAHGCSGVREGIRALVGMVADPRNPIRAASSAELMRPRLTDAVIRCLSARRGHGRRRPASTGIHGCPE